MRCREDRRGEYNARRRVSCAWGLALLIVVVSAPGCAGMRGFGFRRHQGPFAPGTPCALSKNPTAEEVVQHVNRNVEKIRGWRANSVSIRAQSVPIPLEGFLAVERDRRLRLVVKTLLSPEVDLGSNDEHFWIWANPRGKMPNAVYYAAHEDMEIARQNLPLPFEPEWLMEALGVVPLSAENVHLEGEPGVAAVRLVSTHVMPDGQPMKKVIVVNACHGYVMEHSIYDMNGQPIVRAVLQTYERDPTSGAVLPHYVKLDWPQAEMSFAMEMGHIEVNPTTIPDTVWQMTQIPGTPMVNLGDPRLGGHQYASRRPKARDNLNHPVAAGPRPTVLATTAEELDPAFLPAMDSQYENDSEFAQPFASDPEPEFEPPRVDEPAGRAKVDLLPELEPF